MQELNPVARSEMQVIAALPAHYQRIIPWTTKGSADAADRRTLVSPEAMAVNVGGRGYLLETAVELDAMTAASWDNLVTVDYTVAASRAGKDFYVYACQQFGTPPRLLLSANATVPDGYTADSSRKIGGFHCLCVDAGVIAGHPLSGYLAGDLLPASIWDLQHRPTSNPEGMVYDPMTDMWVDIYLVSGTGGASGSVYGATISDSRNWMDFVDDLGAIGKRLLTDAEFQTAAAGSNEKTNIAGSADPVTTGGHVDTAGRRMLSHIGCEDMCGAMWQWLLDQSYRYDGGSHNHGDPYAPANVDPAPSWAYYALPGDKGSLYRQGSNGDVKLRAGGSWSLGSSCGSRSRAALSYRWNAYSALGARGCARSRRA